MGREVFAEPFANALQLACKSRGMNQKQIGELIAVRQFKRHKRGPERERAIEAAKRNWPHKISSWKGDRLPASPYELFLALDVIAPSTTRQEWEERWRRARDDVRRRQDPPNRPLAGPYSDVVQDICPEHIKDRVAEISEIARFCVDSNGSPYMWWQAPAWSGKSAIASWFALHPPEKIRVVAFFVSARSYAHCDRAAFTEVVIDQLRHMLREAPEGLPPAAREYHMRDLLAQAGRASRACGERLILLVDGLDEDLGVNGNPDAHSIAGLLPARPPEGVRILVTGRPDPSLPLDVPKNHPLRDPAMIRLLSPSPHAKIIQEEAERELRRLLCGTKTEQDLLGFVTTAGGGLTLTDLAELLRATPEDVAETLATANGRTFARKTAMPMSKPGIAFYELAHTELLTLARHLLGEKRLDMYRVQLLEWADRYQDAGWPAETPRYLLHEYPALLRAETQVARMLACAGNPSRHERLRQETGGDAAALTEIANAQEAILAAPEADLEAVAVLAIHQDELSSRNTWLPPALPAVWAALGEHARAESLARSVRRSDRRAAVMTALAPYAVGPAQIERTIALATDIQDPPYRAAALTAVAKAVAANGDLAQALAVLQAIDQPDQQAHALAALVALADGARDNVDAKGQAEHVVDLSVDAALRAAPLLRAPTLAAVVASAAGHIAPGRAELLALEIDEAEHQVAALSALALAAAPDDRERARRLLDLAERAAVNVRSYHKDKALSSLASAAVAIGDLDCAEMLVTPVAHESGAVAAVAAAMVIHGDLQRAMALAQGSHPEALAGVAGACAAIHGSKAALAVVDSIRDMYWMARALTNVASALAGAESIDRLVERVLDMVWQIYPDLHPDKILTDLAVTVVRTGDLDRAVAVTQRVPASHDRRRAQSVVAVAIAERGDLDRAVVVAGMIDDLSDRANTMASIALVAVRQGNLQHAERLAEQAEHFLRTPREPGPSPLLALLAQLLAEVGELELAVGCARASSDPGSWSDPLQPRVARIAAAIARHDPDRAEEFASTIFGRLDALVAVASVAVEVGDLDRARNLLDRHFGDDEYDRGRAVVEIVPLIASRDLSGAQQLADSIADVDHRIDALTAVAGVAADCGEAPWVLTLTEQVLALTTTVDAPDTSDYLHEFHVSAALTKLSAALALVGRFEQAEAVARQIRDRRDRNKAARAVVAALADADHPELAEAVLRDEYLWPYGDRPPHQLIASWIRLGAPDRVEALTPRQDAARRDRSGVLADLAKAFADLGDFDRARSAALRIEDGWYRNHALASLTKALADAGYLTAAESTAREITDRSAQRPVMRALAVACARTGDTTHTDALIAAALEPPAVHVGEQEQTFTEVALATAEAGDVMRAEHLTRSIIETHARVDALIQLAQRTPPPTARRLLAHALVEGVTEDSLQLLATMQPEAIRKLAGPLIPAAVQANC